MIMMNPSQPAILRTYSTPGNLTRRGKVAKDIGRSPWTLELARKASPSTIAAMEKQPRVKALIEKGTVPKEPRAQSELVCNLMECQDVQVLTELMAQVAMSKLFFSSFHPQAESAWKTLAAALPHGCTIETLELVQLSLSFPACGQLLQCLDRMPKLTRLSLIDVNTFQNAPLQHVPKIFPHLPELKTLHASGFVWPLLGRIQKYAKPEHVTLSISGDKPKMHAYLVGRFARYGGPVSLNVCASEKCLMAYGALLKSSSGRLSAVTFKVPPEAGGLPQGPLLPAMLKALEGNKGVAKLSLADCSLFFFPEQARDLAALANLGGLRVLDLGGNCLAGSMFSTFFTALGPGARLQRLDLRVGAWFGPKGFDALASWLEQNKTLTHLYLPAPREKQDLERLVQAMKANSTLRKLHCQALGPYPEVAKELGEYIRRNRHRARSSFVFGGVGVLVNRLKLAQNGLMPSEIVAYIASMVDSDETAASLSLVSPGVLTGAQDTLDKRDAEG